MNISNGCLIKCCLLLAAFKFLLIPAYRSTDFEVHRNWLAITSSLPLDQWYTDETSLWTLDYPPLFAWFEKCLASIAQWFDADMLVVGNLNYASSQTVLFQRITVIFTDFVLAYAVWLYVSEVMSKPSKEKISRESLVVALLILLNVGLVVVDHIHFQYNGFLFGVFLLSVVRICQGRNVEACVWFAALLNLKHLYLYVAPAYGVYLLRNYCFMKHRRGMPVLTSFSLQRLLMLAVAGMSVFILSFGPFIVNNQLFTVLARLFPFKRGLCHAYWAPNFWALYNVADKALTVAGGRLGLISIDNHTASMTAGLVQEYDHVVLPSIRPLHTLVLTVTATVPSLVHACLHAVHWTHFVRCISMCAFAAFMFGWHVHEKAILIVIIPMTLLVADKKTDASQFLLLSTVGHFSLLPLIFTSAETVLKYSLYLCYTLFSFYSVGSLYRRLGGHYQLPLLSFSETILVMGLVPLELYCQGLHHWLGVDRTLPFLALMLTSVYCAVGVSYVWLKANYLLWTS